MKQSLLKTAFLDTVPVLTGYLFLGSGFGILLSESGLGIGWALLMSMCVYAGSGQYLLVSLLSSGASLVSVALSTLLVNIRHLFYGLTMIDKYKTAGKRRFYMMFALTDETYSLVTQAKTPEGVKKSSYCFLVSLLNQCYWIVGCVAGSAIGALVPIDFTGVSFVLTALFVTMFVEQWLSTKDHGPAIVGVVCTAVCLLIFGKDWFLIPAMAAIAGILLLRRGKEASGND